MAGKITHIEVLSQTIKLLEQGKDEHKKITKLLKNELNFKYANMGSIAPDIFYYYHVLSPKKTAKAHIWGNAHHHTKVVELILTFLDLVHVTEDSHLKEKMLAFTLGYICHCVVDTITHPYIFFITGDYYNKDPKISSIAQYNHLKVEYSLDSYLLQYRWGMKPNEYDFMQYVDIRKPNTDKIDSAIWLFWLEALRLTFPEKYHAHYLGSEHKIIPGDLINDSYIGFLRFSTVMDSRSKIIRNLLKFVDKFSNFTYKTSIFMLPLIEQIDQRIMNDSHSEWHYPADSNRKSTESFIELVNKSAHISKEVFIIAWDYLHKNIDKESILKKYNGYNLDTGLRFQEVSQMTDFAPLSKL